MTEALQTGAIDTQIIEPERRPELKLVPAVVQIDLDATPAAEGPSRIQRLSPPMTEEQRQKRLAEQLEGKLSVRDSRERSRWV